MDGGALGLGYRHIRPGTAAFAADLTYNPRFVAWKLGLIPEWTSCDQPVTGFPHWLRRSRTALSELISTADPTA